MIRIFLADDHRLFRQGLLSLLQREPGIEIVGEADDGLEAVRLVAQIQPDVVLMDVHMPGLRGPEATRRILQAHPQIAILMLTVSEKDEDLLEAIRAGARGYLLKNVDADELIAAIRRVAHGKAVLPQPLVARLMEAVRQQGQQPTSSSFDILTEREREVLYLLAEGATNREIAATLVLSEQTVKTHVHHIFQKLGVSNRAQAVAVAARHGLLPSSLTAALPHLTARERMILELLADGASNAEIADTLEISRYTVKTHIHHILKKLGVQNRAEAVAYALRHGLFSSSDEG